MQTLLSVKYILLNFVISIKEGIKYTRQNKFRHNFNRGIDDFGYNISKEYYFQLVAETFIQRIFFFQFPACIYRGTSYNQ